MCCLNTYTDWLLSVGSKVKVKAIPCHYYRHIKESLNTDESCGAKDESDGESGDEKYEEEFDSGKDERDNDFVFNDLDEKSNSWQTIQFISDDQRGGIMKSSTANVGGGGGAKTTRYPLRGDHVSAQLSQQKSPTPRR